MVTKGFPEVTTREDGAVDIVVSIYSHTHHHISCPTLDFGYLESDTGNGWLINAAVDRAFFVRIGNLLEDKDYSQQAFESELLKKRLECALLMSGTGLFAFSCSHEFSLTNIRVSESSSVTCALATSGSTETAAEAAVIDWFAAFSKWAWLQRAAEDAYLALTIQSESVLFTYRALEWLKKGLNRSWDRLGDAIDIPSATIRWLKREANSDDLGSRHAAESGKKWRFKNETLYMWTQGVLHGIVQARCKLDEDFSERISREGDPWPIEEVSSP